jgi:hypothetical protein
LLYYVLGLTVRRNYQRLCVSGLLQHAKVR